MCKQLGLLLFLVAQMYRLLLVYCISLCSVLGARIGFSKVFNIRGGIVPEATPDGEYYEKFQLDYGCEDNVRLAGRMMGLLKPGKISSLVEKDPLFSWLNEKLERGPQPPTTRFKPYYAADFGAKDDLKKGENPKIIIVNRKLAAAEDGSILAAPKGPADLDIREVWQPWLKSRCNFVVRYIVPNRANIMELMESEGRFRAEMHFGQDIHGARTATAHMVFKPTLWERLQGKKDIVMKRALDARNLFETTDAAKARYREMKAKKRSSWFN